MRASAIGRAHRNHAARWVPAGAATRRSRFLSQSWPAVARVARSRAQPSGDRVRAGLAPVRRGRVPPRQGTGTRLAQLACASGTDRSGAALALERPRVVSGRYGLPPCCLALRTWRERWRRPCIVRTPTHVIAVRADGIVTRPSCPPSLNPVDGQLVCETNMWSSSACGH